MGMRGFPFKRSPDTRRFAFLSLALAVGSLCVGDSAAEASSIVVKATDCQRLVQHRASADVAYKPGVDVNGNPVAPADLPGSVTIKTPTEITFNVTFDLLKNYGVSEDSALTAEGDAAVGEVKYNLMSGALTYNGQRLDDAETAALADLCAAAEGK